MNILITGGAGFIGSNFVRYLLKKSFLVDKIIILDNLCAGQIENIKDILEGSDQVKFVKGDVRNSKLLNSLLEDVDVVVHLAALVDVQESFKDPFIYEEINSRGTLSILNVCAEKDVRKFIYASSAAVYGEAKCSPIKEDDCCHPLSPYAVTKLSGEYYCKLFSEEYDINSISLRFFNVYGPGQRMSEYAGVIYKFLINIIKGEDIVIFGDGKQIRNFVYVDDVAEAIILSINNLSKGYKVYNVGTGVGTSILALADRVLQLVDTDINMEYAPPRKGDIKFSIADISRIKNEIGFTPSISLEEGLSRTLDFMKGRIRL